MVQWAGFQLHCSLFRFQEGFGFIKFFSLDLFTSFRGLAIACSYFIIALHVVSIYVHNF
jgi:hypothetical protein